MYDLAVDLKTVTPAGVRRALRERTEIGLLDVRPEGIYSDGHPLFAASFPLGRLEVDAFDRLPRRSAPLVVYGQGVGDASVAIARLQNLGYVDVSLLEGGIAGWSASGGEIFRDVNTPSKAFGELVAAIARTPAIPPEDLAAMLSSGSDVVVVDARRFEEYQTMSIPTATNVPGAELVMRVGTLAPDPATTVVVNCAGRTRSIIGTQSLINAGLPNRVLALRNGTIGWKLAGFALEHGTKQGPPQAGQQQARWASDTAWAVAARVGVRQISGSELQSIAQAGTRTVYRFDVRTPEEYAAGHRVGFRSAPGGQLVQETDSFAPIRGALVVIAGDEGGRAAMTASWLAQMGWEVRILQAEADASQLKQGPWQPSLPSLPVVKLVSSDELETWVADAETVVIDVDSSPRFRAGHVPGAAWAQRTDLPAFSWRQVAERLSKKAVARLVLTSADGILATFAAATDAQRGERRDEPAVFVHAGGTAGWSATGRRLETGPEPVLSATTDVYRRPYEGTSVHPAAMQAYLEWEYGLVAQLERDGTHGFNVLA